MNIHVRHEQLYNEYTYVLTYVRIAQYIEIL